MLVTKDQIADYIPQRSPIVMIDDILSYDDKSIVTQFIISETNMMVSDGFFMEPGIIENIAQTAAAKAGYAVKKLGMEPVIGFIGAVKDLKIVELPKVGDVIKTTVTVRMEVMGVTLIDGFSECNGKRIAECEMKIFLQKNEDAKP